MPKHLVIIHRSVGWDKDSRIRKLINSFSKKSFEISALIWERANLKQTKTINKKTKIYLSKIALTSKQKIRGGALISFFEIIQEFFQGLFFIIKKKPTLILIQNHRQFLHLLSSYFYKFFFERNVKIIWDLREIPPFFERNIITKFFFSLLCLIPSHIWVMNKGRLNHMIDIYKISKKKFHIVSNFCEKEYWKSDKDILGIEFQKFVKHYDYVYIQNPFLELHYGFNSIASVLAETKNKIICTGNITSNLMENLTKMFGSQVIRNRVLFTGVLSEKDLKPLIDNCVYSIILYDYEILNQYFCDPNRFYHCISRGIPVIVGKNPGMADKVKLFGLGVIANDDGRDLNLLRKSVLQMELMKDSFSEESFKRAEKFLIWEQNNKVFDLL